MLSKTVLFSCTSLQIKVEIRPLIGFNLFSQTTSTCTSSKGDDDTLAHCEDKREVRSQDVEGEVLQEVELPRLQLQVLRPLRLGDELQQPDGIPQRVAPFLCQQVCQLADSSLVPERILAELPQFAMSSSRWTLNSDDFTHFGVSITILMVRTVSLASAL